jgi:transcription elongation GreA/GreB family factor
MRSSRRLRPRANTATFRKTPNITAARERQSFVEGRIQELEGKISRAEIIDIASLMTGNTSRFGATVTLIDDDTDENVTYQIVGDDEANIKARPLLSISSPSGARAHQQDDRRHS